MLKLKRTVRNRHHNNRFGNPCLWAGVALLLAGYPALSGCANVGLPAGNHMPGWSRSAEALCRQVLAAVVRSDRAGLEALSISEPEYMRHVWPGLPVSRVPQWQAQAGFVWNQHRMKSLDGLNSVLARYGGTGFEFVSLRFVSPATPYETCVIHSDARMTVRDETGKETELTFFSSLVEKDGKYKIFSYARH